MNNDFNLQRITTAKQLAPGAVQHALELVDFDGNVEAAMKFVFGSTLICRGNNHHLFAY